MKTASDVKIAWPCAADNCDAGDGASILIDLSGAGYVLTDAAKGVSLDASADGKPRQVAWSAGDAEVGFLVLNSNVGRVDSGPALFAGAASAFNARLIGTPAAQGARFATSGLAALAVYDQPVNGGNADGRLDANDAVYAQLRIWVDKNHDGIPRSDEVFTLA